MYNITVLKYYINMFLEENYPGNTFKYIVFLPTSYRQKYFLVSSELVTEVRLVFRPQHIIGSMNLHISDSNSKEFKESISYSDYLHLIHLPFGFKIIPLIENI